MSVDIVIGAQFGSEGKGKICAYLGITGDYAGAIRTGGPNAAHTVIHEKNWYLFRHIPSAAINRSLELVIGPGSYIDSEILAREIRNAGNLDIARRLYIDRLVGLITADHIAKNAMFSSPTTGLGVGPAIAERALRSLRCIRDLPPTFGSVVDVAEYLVPRLDRDIFLLEGAQGFGLSFYQNWYPHSTSRDISVAALLSEAALPRNSVRDVYGVFRAFPIRTIDSVTDLGTRETSWEAITRLADASPPIKESSSVDGAVRRVARFSTTLAQRFVLLNRPTFACLTFADYLDARARGARVLKALPPRVRAFIDDIEGTLGIRVGLVSTGPDTFDMVDLR